MKTVRIVEAQQKSNGTRAFNRLEKRGRVFATDGYVYIDTAMGVTK